MKKYKQSLRKMQDILKYTIIHVMDVPEGEEQEKGAEKICEEIMV